eukprot:scaffold49326_cov29-Tisochrysis_lutea.AAC.4
MRLSRGRLPLLLRRACVPRAEPGVRSRPDPRVGSGAHVRTEGSRGHSERERVWHPPTGVIRPQRAMVPPSWNESTRERQAPDGAIGAQRWSLESRSAGGCGGIDGCLARHTSLRYVVGRGPRLGSGRADGILLLSPRGSSAWKALLDVRTDTTSSRRSSNARTTMKASSTPTPSMTKRATLTISLYGTPMNATTPNAEIVAKAMESMAMPPSGAREPTSDVSRDKNMAT